MKTLSGRKAPRYDKNQFHGEITVSTWTVFEMHVSLLKNPELVSTNRQRVSQLALAHQCVLGQGPEYMWEVFRTNEAAGCRMTRKYMSVNTELYRKSFAMKGTQKWNSLRDNLRGVLSFKFKVCTNLLMSILGCSCAQLQWWLLALSVFFTTCRLSRMEQCYMYRLSKNTWKHKGAHEQ